MKIKILGKQWTVKWVNYLGPGVLGDCSNPEQEKLIRYKTGLRGKEELETYIHEFEHATNWLAKSEEYVGQVSEELSDFLWRLGYRKVANKRGKNEK